MTALDPATLITLLTADPAQRQAAVQRMLLERMGGNAAGLDLATALVNTGAPQSPPQEDPTPALRGLYREAELLNAELRRATGLLADAARALGACPRCLGTDDACEACGGDGAPGRDEPDAERFEELVAPAVRRLTDETGPIAHTMEEQDT